MEKGDWSTLRGQFRGDLHTIGCSWRRSRQEREVTLYSWLGSSPSITAASFCKPLPMQMVEEGRKGKCDMDHFLWGRVGTQAVPTLPVNFPSHTLTNK